jgi:hypothetical protein
MEDLYQVFSMGVRFFLYRQLGPRDLDDKDRDVFVIVAQTVRRSGLRDPERLMGYVRTVLRRQVAGHIEEAVKNGVTTPISRAPWCWLTTIPTWSMTRSRTKTKRLPGGF